MEGIGLEKEEGSREFEFEHTEAFSSFAEAQSGNLVDWMHLVKIKLFRFLPVQIEEWDCIGVY